MPGISLRAAPNYYPQLQGNCCLDFCCHRLLLLVFELYTKENLQWVFFCIWLPSLTIMSVRLSHVLSIAVDSWFLLLAMFSSIAWTDHHLFFSSPVEGCVVCFQPGAIVIKAAIIFLRVSTDALMYIFLLGRYLRAEQLDLRVCICRSCQFPNIFVPIYTATSCIREFQSLHILANTWYYHFLHFSYSGGCIVETHVLIPFP